MGATVRESKSLHPSRGQASAASIGGHDLALEASSVRRLIGYVPQGLSSDPDLTARENLQILAALYDIPRPQRAELSVAICLTTHYMDEAQHLCCRFLVMRNGTAVALVLTCVLAFMVAVASRLYPRIII